MERINELPTLLGEFFSRSFRLSMVDVMHRATYDKAFNEWVTAAIWGELQSLALYDSASIPDDLDHIALTRMADGRYRLSILWTADTTRGRRVEIHDTMRADALRIGRERGVPLLLSGREGGRLYSRTALEGERNYVRVARG